MNVSMKESEESETKPKLQACLVEIHVDGYGEHGGEEDLNGKTRKDKES